MSRNAFAQLDSDDSDNEDVKADVTVETPTVDDGANIDANKDDRTEGQKSKVSLKAQWDRGSSRGQYSPSRSLNKAADIKKSLQRLVSPRRCLLETEPGTARKIS